MGDRGRILQILLNLLSNAVKFTPPGGRIVVAALHKLDQVVISVKDSGIGIAAEHQTRIFEDFSKSRTRSSDSWVVSALGWP